MSDKAMSAWNLPLIGGRLCLDFANTVDWHASENPRENLNTFNDLIIWSEHVGILTRNGAKRLTLMAVKSPSKAKVVLQQAIELREVIYRIFSSVTAGKTPKKEDLFKFNENLSKAMVRSRIVKTKAGFSWDTSGDKDSLDWMLNPVIRSVADLLVSGELKRVKRCVDPQCGWLFLDVSRNKSRRWCDMKDCGNRAKASRFYERKKEKRLHS
jgi:predicted RNA-binding Zn ribbon-like protein